MNPDYNDILNQHRQVIDQFGWAVTSVEPTEDEPCPPYSYTTGLTAHGQPELLITGLLPDVAACLLNNLAARALAEPSYLHDGAVLHDLLDGYAALVVEADPTPDLRPGVAEALYADAPIRLRQIVWPNRKGWFPGEPGYDIPDHIQPLLRKP